MVTLLLLQAALYLGGLGIGFIDAVPIPDASGVVDPVESGIYAMGQHLEGMDNWIPFASLGPALAIIAVAILFQFGVRALRILLSISTGGGGTGA